MTKLYTDILGKEIHNSDIVMSDGGLEVVFYPQENSIVTNLGLRRNKFLIVNQVDGVKENTKDIFEKYAKEIEQGKEKEQKQQSGDVPLYYIICIHGVVNGETQEDFCIEHLRNYISGVIPDKNHLTRCNNTLTPDSKLKLSLIPIKEDQRTKSAARDIVSKYVSGEYRNYNAVIVVRDCYCTDEHGVKYKYKYSGYSRNRKSFTYSKSSDKMFQLGSTWSTRVTISNIAFTEKTPLIQKLRGYQDRDKIYVQELKVDDIINLLKENNILVL